MRLVIDVFGGNANRHKKLDQFLRVILTKDKWVLDSRPVRLFFPGIWQNPKANLVQDNVVGQIIAAFLMNGILFLPFGPYKLHHFFLGVIYLRIVSAKQHPSS